MIIKNQKIENDINKFPYLKEYIEEFNLTEEILNNVFFAYDNIVYTKINPLTVEKRFWDYVQHEQVHFKQQEKYGLENWIKQYLSNDKFRLEMEIEAYKTQSFLYKDRNGRAKFIEHASNVLSSPIYGNIITKNEARLKLL